MFSFGVVFLISNCLSSFQVPCRILKRPWAADEVLNQVMDKVILSSSSITQRIENSPTFSDVFGKFCSKQESSVDGSRIKNLRAQKNRFASFSKPLGRTCLFLDSVIKTAQWIAVQRKGDDCAADALAFLDFLDEERCLLLSMLSECADECVQLVRFFDTESYDVASIPEQISIFVNRLKYLFIDGAVMDSGYTLEMVTFLGRQRAVIDSRGNPKTLGGGGRLTAQMRDRCLNRLRLFVDLAMETLRSEFPDYDMVMAFSIFRLDAKGFSQNKHQERLERLANVFGLDLQELTNQFYDVRPMALHEYAKGCNSAQAWVRTVQRIELKQVAVRKHHPTTMIRSLVMRC